MLAGSVGLKIAIDGAGLRGGGVMDNTGRTVSLELDEPVADRFGFCSRVRKKAGKREVGVVGAAKGDAGATATAAGGESAFRKKAGKREAPPPPPATGARFVVMILVALSLAEIWARDGTAPAAGESG